MAREKVPYQEAADRLPPSSFDAPASVSDAAAPKEPDDTWVWLWLLFAYLEFEEINESDVDKRTNIGRGWLKFQKHANKIAVANVLWLLYDYLCLAWALLYCWGMKENALLDQPQLRWFQVHAMGISSDWYVAIWTFIKAWFRAQATILSLSEIRDHLIPAALNGRKERRKKR